jgi:hypothetical protein
MATLGGGVLHGVVGRLHRRGARGDRAAGGGAGPGVYTFYLINQRALLSSFIAFLASFVIHTDTHNVNSRNRTDNPREWSANPGRRRRSA